MRPVRVSVKAIIIRDERLLVTRNRDRESDFFLLPGGGQEPGESLPEALQRECREEIGAEVEVHELLLVRDYVARNHEFAEGNEHFHQVEIMFRCTLLDDATLGAGSSPDGWQTGVEWLDLTSLDDARLYPAVLKRALPALGDLASIYLGDVN
jgi:ADP-ribose pyrophosphatase YjhB (NUDIX family)